MTRSETIESRVRHLLVLLITALCVLIIRLAHLQLIQGSHYRELAEQNRLRLVPDTAPRGLIVDRRGNVLASNRTIFRVALIPQEVEDLESVLQRVGRVTERSVDRLKRSLRHEQDLAFVPAVLVTHVPKEVAFQLEEERWRFPGLLVKPETVRGYPNGRTAVHLLGYLGEPPAKELPRLKRYGVSPKHLVGRSGLERKLDYLLSGRPGGSLVEVNNRGRQVRVLGERTAQMGDRVVLTIDAQLQSLVEEAFGAKPGAVVVLKPQTGEVLAMVSSPGFDPEAFALQEQGTIQRLLNDLNAPLMNRATSGLYTPGSIVKLAVAAAALENEVITAQTNVVCRGAVRIGDRVFHCWNRDGHGPMQLTDAIAQSCNIYFMQVARWLGEKRLHEALAEVGFGRKTGWILHEQAGQLPERRLTGGEVAILGIGQGEILITVMQAAVMASTFANAGRLVAPWVVRAVPKHAAAGRGIRSEIGWSAETLKLVRTGMEEVIANPAGTGRRAFSRGVSIAGKTGTAQTHIPERPHGWFVGFCPAEKPKAAMAIVTEHGGSGGSLPAEIAKAICEYVSLPDVL